MGCALYLMFLLHILLDTIGRKIHENNFKGTSFKTCNKKKKAILYMDFSYQSRRVILHTFIRGKQIIF